MPGLVSFSALALFCASVVYTDLKSHRVPNLLNVLGFAAGFCISYFTRGFSGVATGLAGSLLGISILFVPFLMHMVGGGDVKFLGAAGALVGWQALWISFVAGAAFGGLLGVILLIVRDRSWTRLRNRFVLILSGAWRRPPTSTTPGHLDEPLPYTIPLSLGLITVTSIAVFG